MSSSQPIPAQSASPARPQAASAALAPDVPMRDAGAGDQIEHEDQEDEPEPEPEPEHEPEEEEEEEEEEDADEEITTEKAGRATPSAPVPPTKAPTTAPSKGKSKAKAKPVVTDVQWGQTRFPIARVQRLLKADENIDHVSKEATFLITIAAELFVKSVAERAYAVGRLEKRRYIAYNDVQNVVSKDIHWSYLRDVVPDPVHYSDAIASRENLARQKANVAADFFGVPPAPGLERNSEYEAGQGMFPDEHDESDVEMREV